MKKSDILTTLGLVIGFLMMIWGMAMETFTKLNFKQLALFWDPASVVITIFGSACAMLVNYTLDDFKKLLKIMGGSFKTHIISSTEMIVQFSEISKKARKDGFIALEEDINQLEDEFLKKGLQMVIDGVEPETIKEVLELEIDEISRRNNEGAELLKAWGGYAPAFGMIGTLIGLIQMLGNLSDSSQIASGMAKALITTYYGALAANLVFNPMAANILAKSEKEITMREMMVEGVLAIQSGVNPRIVEQKLLSYLSPEERTKFVANAQTAEGVE